MTHLCLFQIGPVQSFIAAGRRTQDLYVGSRLLSVLAFEGVNAIQNTNSTLIFPVLDENNPPESIPHRFACTTEDDPDYVANEVESAILNRWQRIAESVRTWLINRVPSGTWIDTYDRQVLIKNTREGKSWIEFYWVAVDYNPNEHGQSFVKANRAMAARKLLRHFPVIHEPGVKCTLTGAASALADPQSDTGGRWWAEVRKALNDNPRPPDEPKVIRTNEALGALALIKRISAHRIQHNAAPIVDKNVLGFVPRNFPATDEIAGLADDQRRLSSDKEVEGYLAVLHMDGDQMGKKLGQLQSQEAHQAFSRVLAQFARENVPQIVRRYDGQPRAALVYAGGDDVVALLPLHAVLTCADDIRREYERQLTAVLPPEVIHEAGKPTMSAGIAVVPSGFPLDAALNIARAAEKSAKHEWGRNAIVVTEAHGTGKQRSAGAKWELPESNQYSLAALMARLQAAFGDPQQLSTKIGYDFQELAYALDTPTVPRGAREAELRRLLKRRSETFLGSEEVKALIEELAPLLFTWGEAIGWEALANWVILARFLASDGKVKP